MLVDTPPTSPETQADEAAHLTRLIERQPACLIRVALDGVMLAANDAALALLGTDKLELVLGKKITEQVAPDHQDAWRDFAVRVWNTQSGSLECDMVDPAGTRRGVQMRGIALTDHPDTLHTILVVIRDMSATQRLEQALQEHEAMRRVVADLNAKLQQAGTAREQLQAALDQHDAAHKQAIAEQESERQQLTQVANQSQAALAQQKSESQRALLAMHSELERSLAEVRRLEEAMAQATADRRQLLATLKQREAERQQTAPLLDNERAARQQAEAAIEELREEHDQFEGMVKQREATRQRALAEHATARMQAEKSLADANARIEQLSNALAAQGLDLKNAAKHLEMLAQRFIKPERT